MVICQKTATGPRDAYVLEIVSVDRSGATDDVEWAIRPAVSGMPPLEDFFVEIQEDDYQGDRDTYDHSSVVKRRDPVRRASGVLSVNNLHGDHDVQFRVKDVGGSDGYVGGGSVVIPVLNDGTFPEGKLDEDSIGVVSRWGAEQIDSGEIEFTGSLYGRVTGGEPEGMTKTTSQTFKYGVSSYGSLPIEIVVAEKTVDYTVKAGEELTDLIVTLPAPEDDVTGEVFGGSWKWKAPGEDQDGGLSINTFKDGSPFPDTTERIDGVEVTYNDEGAPTIRVTISNPLPNRTPETADAVTTDVAITVDGEATETVNVTIPPLNSRVVELERPELESGGVSIEVETDNDFVSRRLTLGTPPQPDPSEPDPVEPGVNVSCDFDGATIQKGQPVTVGATVETGDGTTDTTATVQINAAGEAATETVTLGPNSTARVEATFEISEPGEYQPTVTLE